MEEVDHSSAGVDGGAHYTYVQLRLRQSRQPRTSQSAAEVSHQKYEPANVILNINFAVLTVH
eukprot:SAG31_NODE_541_length_14275_cov_6.690886_8_plen_62_part_00